MGTKTTTGWGMAAGPCRGLIIAVPLALLLAWGCSDPCKKVDCLNGGTCLEGGCDCPPGWTGEDCGTDECALMDCRNGADCVGGVCQCPPGFYGELCESSFQGRFIGKWTADHDCVTSIGGTSSEHYTLLITAGGNNLEINLYLGSMGWVTADIDDLSSYTIPYQSRFSIVFTGEGRLVNDTTLEMSFTRNPNGLWQECTTRAIRQP